MKRVAVIGCGGSGKTTLATRLGEVTGLPVVHLDRHYWREGWKETQRDEWESLQREMCGQPEWIMDGNYGGTMNLRLEAADTIIFLDYSTWACLWGAISRWLRYRGQSRPDMTRGCPERLEWPYLRWIWTYRARRRPGILERLNALATTRRVVILRSRQEADGWMESRGWMGD
jgi:adenylate kinase family enzyme